MAEKHLFALFTPYLFADVDASSCGRPCVITDTDLWHRLSYVLRMPVGQEFIAFNGTKQLQLTLSRIHKKNAIECLINGVQFTAPLQPTIHVYQGVLKRDAMDAVAYFAAQMGATSLTPLITTKSQRSWGADKESERIKKVMVAACEQAKQFAIPTIQKAFSINEACAQLPEKSLSLYCEPEGMPFYQALSTVVNVKPETIALFIGPEGGFTQEEEKLLRDQAVQCYALTPTILRSQEAVAVSLGAIRSVILSFDVAQ